MLPSDFRHLAARGRGVGACAGGKTAVGGPNHRPFRTTLQLVLASTSAAEVLQRQAEDLGLFQLHGSNGTGMSHDHMWRRRPL